MVRMNRVDATGRAERMLSVAGMDDGVFHNNVSFLLYSPGHIQVGGVLLLLRFYVYAQVASEHG